MHSGDIIHRDIKPENLLLGADGSVKVADFGAAIHAPPPHHRRTPLCGTPEYLAPEIIQSLGHGKPVDWWALGILIYECLSGESPFSANDQNAICRKIVQRSFKYPKTAMFTPDAKDIIDKLLQKKGSDRLASGPSGASAVKNHPSRGSALIRQKRLRPLSPNNWNSP